MFPELGSKPARSIILQQLMPTRHFLFSMDVFWGGESFRNPLLERMVGRTGFEPVKA